MRELKAIHAFSPEYKAEESRFIPGLGTGYSLCTKKSRQTVAMERRDVTCKVCLKRLADQSELHRQP
jgi:hypothetical protein